MGRKKWTTSEQDTWLSLQVPKFVEAQKDKTISQFFTPIYSAFHETWPYREPTQKEIGAEGGDKAKATAKIFKKENEVPYPIFHLTRIQLTLRSGFIGGISTIHARQRRERTRETC